MNKSIAMILKAVMTTVAPCLLQIPMDIGYWQNPIAAAVKFIYYTALHKTYSSNESPPREVNLIVSMHSSALFMVAIQ